MSAGWRQWQNVSWRAPELHNIVGVFTKNDCKMCQRKHVHGYRHWGRQCARFPHLLHSLDHDCKLRYAGKSIWSDILFGFLGLRSSTIPCEMMTSSINVWNIVPDRSSCNEGSNISVDPMRQLKISALQPPRFITLIILSILLPGG